MSIYWWNGWLLLLAGLLHLCWIRLRTFLAEALVQSWLEEAALKGQIKRQGHNSLARQNSISDLFEALRSVGFRNAKTLVK